MSNLHTIHMAVIDTQNALQRELQFSADALKQVRTARALRDEAQENYDRVVDAALEERMRTLSLAIGNGSPSPETIEVAKVGAQINAG